MGWVVEMVQHIQSPFLRHNSCSLEFRKLIFIYSVCVHRVPRGGPLLRVLIPALEGLSCPAINRQPIDLNGNSVMLNAPSGGAAGKLTLTIMFPYRILRVTVDRHFLICLLSKNTSNK